VQRLSSDQRKRVYIGLYQCHLPKMDDAGVIDFDKDRGEIVLRESAEQLREYLDSIETEPPFGTPYSAPIALTLSAIVLGGVADIGSLVVVPDVVWTVLATLALLGLAALQSFHQWGGSLPDVPAVSALDPNSAK